ncbi:MAG: ATP synthase F0 subunit B [Eubacteriales bacterium]|nr:ATP synthase F0 subunit B [Eubacteriales bacterium]
MNIPLNIDWQQILLHLFNFVILTAGLYVLLYQPVKDFMKKRETYYQGLSDAAQGELEKAQQLRKSCDEKWNAAEEEIRQRKAAAALEMEQEKRQNLEETKEQCESLLCQARENADMEKKRILESAREEAALLAVSALEKLSTSAKEGSLEAFLEEAERGSRA